MVKAHMAGSGRNAPHPIMNVSESHNDGPFSLVVGGPFHSLMQRAGLTGPDRLPTWRGALIVAFAAWLLPALLASVQALTSGEHSGLDFFSDWTAHTRYLIAVAEMLATERYADCRLLMLASHFHEAGLLPEESQAAFRAALERADRRSASPLAEALILVLALIGAAATTDLAVDLAARNWMGQEVSGDVVLSWAGWAARMWSTPLFLFLVLRWLWRFGVWAALLYRIARMPLRLTPLHPDRSAGLGFLAIYPSIFNGFIFAQSCVVASAMVQDIGLEHRSGEIVWLAIGVWLALCLALLLGPLLVFMRPLYQLRERSLIEYGRLASHHHLAFQRKWVSGEREGSELLGSPDASSAADLNGAIETLRQLRFVPVDLPALISLVVAAGLPMLVVVNTQIPFSDMIKWFLGSFV